MKAITLLFLCIFLSQTFSQTNKFDTLKVENKTLIGNVIKINSESVLFKESTTNIQYEYDKDDIIKIILGNGKVLKFDYIPSSSDNILALVFGIIIGLGLIGLIISHGH